MPVWVVWHQPVHQGQMLLGISGLGAQLLNVSEFFSFSVE